MYKSKGFTLLELLAVIILLAVIALITVPVITSTMKDARKSSFKTSMLNLVKAADNYYADNQLDITNSIAFDFLKGGVNEKGEELSFKGTKPKTGRLVINVDGEITLLDVSDGTYYANYNSSSDDDILVTNDNEVMTRDELTEELKNLKKELANTKTELKSEIAKKSNQSDLDKMNTQLASTTTIANTANTTANTLNSTRLNKTYPVGSIYISYNNTNPGTLFGGTWIAYATGRTIVGVDTSQTEFNAIGKTGGEKNHTLTVAEMPSHTHDYGKTPGYMSNVTNGGASIANAIWNQTATSATGGSQPHNNLQPYITVYMWRRTA